MANYVTQAVIPMAIIVLGIACFVYFCVFKLMAKPLPFTLGRPLLSNDFLGAIHGLNRQDIEELMAHAVKWRCLVCAFENAEAATTCVLCDSAKDLESLPLQRSLAQEAATHRHDWQRTLDAHTGQVVWSAIPQVASFVPHAVRPRPDVEIAVDAETAQAALELTILRVRQPRDGATMSLLGTPWPAWFIPQLAALQASSFSTKYLWFLTQLDALPSASIAKLSVHRSKLLDGSLRLLEQLPLDQLCAQTRIELIGEIGVDAGGLQREWYTMLTQAILDESAGLFVATDNYKYTIAPRSSAPPARYRCVGRLLGRALLDGQVLPFHLCTPMYKLLLGLPLSLLDVQFMDLQLYKSLLYVQSTPDVAALSLDFTVATDAQHVVPLVPGGETMAVTVDNQGMYVQVMAEYILFGRIQRQVEHFLAGFFEVLSPEWLAPFDYKELELLLCGLAAISVDDWKQYTSVSAVFTTTDAIVLSWFWEAVADMTNTERAKLLQFATGSTHVPVQGFKGLTSTDGRLCPFSIKAIEYEPGMLPRSHACFNRIDLPVYPSRDELNAALQLLLQMDMTEFALV